MQSEPLRVVHLVAGLGSGGAEKQLYLLCSDDSAAVQYSVISLFREGAWSERLTHLGVPVHALNAKRVFCLKSLFRIAMLLRRLRPAVLHCWLPSMNVMGAVAVLLSLKWRIRVIASVRNIDDWMPRWRRMLQRLVSPRWDLILCNSASGMQWCRNSGLPAGKLRTIANGIDPAPRRTRSERSTSRRTLGVSPDAFVVACAHRLVPQKRTERVLAIARQLSNVTFLIAGAGPEMDRLQRDCPENVRLLGHMADTRPVLAAADLFLMTSDREGTSNSLLEALQIGCAVVATPAGDNASILSNGVGITAEPEELAGAIDRIRYDDERRAAMSELAVKKAAEFSVGKMRSRVIDAYLDVTGAMKAGRTRVLYLDYTNGIGMGGGQRSLLLLLRNLDRSNFCPLLACPPDEQLLDYVEPDVGIRSLALPSAFKSVSRRSTSLLGVLSGLILAFPAINRLRRLMVHEHVHIIHANNLKMLALAVAAQTGRRVPVIWHVRDIFGDSALKRLIRTIGVRFADRVLAVSGAVARQFGGRADVEVLYNAVELPALEGRARQRASARRHYKIPRDARVVGYAGRLDAGKGLDILIDAFDAVRRTSAAPVRLLIAGDGRESERVQTRIAALGIAELCVLVGFEPDMVRAWAAMDVAVAPSTEPDSFPRSVIEAMGHELPVIGSAIGGIGEAIEHGVTGYCVPPGDVELLTTSLIELTTDLERARTMGAAGRLRCERLFGSQRQADRVSEIYNELLTRHLGAK